MTEMRGSTNESGNIVDTVCLKNRSEGLSVEQPEAAG
jgi:hypothetical protein